MSFPAPAPGENPMQLHLPEAYDLSDYEALARERVPAASWAYLAAAAGDGLTNAANRAAYDRLRLLPRVLSDLSKATTRINLMGFALEHPILLAPVAYHRLFHPDGELATAQGAAIAQAPLVVSTQASTSLEEVRAASRGQLWFQLYIQPDWGFTVNLLRRAEAAGYSAVVLTVDAPVSLRTQERRAGFSLPPGVEAVNLAGLKPRPLHSGGIGSSPLFGTALPHTPLWGDVARLRSLTRLPILLKGVLAPDDASRALAEGVDGIIVSNHGGRVLDSLPASIEALPRIVETLEGRIPVLVDGGIRRGTDILKAMALGANAVMIGRPYIHALAVAGAAGVAHAMHVLRAELEVAMALTGRPTLDTVNRSILFDPPAPPAP
ncbi:FMN-dependent alpha-hydroxy acid dehydrogenase [Azorhizobium caulinodans ORS 571]|uniref:FMN-dependent alpha-hydroxy acid dehydrogenase n=2 Tax=Azorhizobium caulinodans TaxID=7 RepID=A8HYI4_AZOC5|nr:FMN-dependent alpha-hydroxy acid dehydrogenase [Azorhizobium caulinodans ORS 571]